MIIRMQSQLRSIAAVLSVIAAIAISVAAAIPVEAQTPPLCDGLPATIVATTPGLITGTTGSDVIVGTAGDDRIVGLGGIDTICAGAGNDTIVWNPGDNSDVIEGEAGADQLLFNSSAASENIDLSANGARLRLFRNVANITLDVADTERVTLNTLAGIDTVTVNDLTGTGVANADLNLAGTLSTFIADAQADTILINATAADDRITVAGNPDQVVVGGMSAQVTIRAIDAGVDSLQINGLGGADQISANTLSAVAFRQFLGLIAAPVSGSSTAISLSDLARDDVPTRMLASGGIKLALNGGAGSDVIVGSSCDDQIVGGPANDTIFLGAGADTFSWNPGDGNDIVEGQDGSDQLLFNGSAANEIITLSANGARLQLLRNIGNITMDLNGIEQISVNALGGADTITVNDLTGVSVTQVSINLAGTLNGVAGDAQPDNVVLNDTNGDDTASISGSAGSAAISGLATPIQITTAEPGQDSLRLNTLLGNDVVDASGLAADSLNLIIDGGDNDDVLIGSAGVDIIFGGAGDDVLIGGPAADVLDGGTGNNVIIQD